MGRSKTLLVIEDGKTSSYNTIKEAAIDLGLSPSTLGARLRRNMDDGRIYIFVRKDEETSDKEKITNLKHEKEKMVYKTKGKRICITPCPHKNWIKIGSVLCQACNHFGGISRKESTILCTFSHLSNGLK